MIGEMLIWGFFSALGWMTANWTVEQILPDSQPSIEKKIDNIEKKIDSVEKKIDKQNKEEQ